MIVTGKELIVPADDDPRTHLPTHRELSKLGSFFGSPMEYGRLIGDPKDPSVESCPRAGLSPARQAVSAKLL